MSKPSPVEYNSFGKTDNQVISERRTTCRDYRSCLDMTIQNRWRGFSCKKCKAFSPANLAPYHGYGGSRDGVQPEEIYG